MKARSQHSPIKSAILALGIGLNLFVAMLTVFSAYGGTFDPETRVIAAMAAMVLPNLLIAGIVIVLIDLIIDARLILIIGAGWLLSLSPILTFCPLNVPRSSLSAEEKERSFNMLTYNIFHFWDFRGEVPGLEKNATLDYILDADADIVNLQEAEAIWENGYAKVTPAQLDSVKARYPYRIINVSDKLSLLSKYPCEEVKLNLDPKVGYVMACFKLDVKGKTFHLLNVHLKSIGLTSDDKEIYKEALNLPENKNQLKREMKEVKSKLLTKLATAFKIRAVQAHAARSVIDSIGGPFIVAGDFNDIPGCYAMRVIRGDDMRDAYADAALGPCITYHGDRFYFRIDHVLYRGPFNAVDIEKGGIESSDHNPLLTTFVFDQ